MIKARALGEEGPHGEKGLLAFAGGGLERAFAPRSMKARERNFDRADFIALSAGRGGVREIARRSDAEEGGREDGADRARVDPAVRVAADGIVDRAVVEAGPAANAPERFAHAVFQHVGAAVVDDDDVAFLGAVRVASGFRSGE